ncbi:hypothetical protein BsWGS_23689 [Bradybaena similaris]
MSTMMKTSILLLVAVMLGSSDAQNYSKKVWDLVATYNGCYNNSERLSENFTKHFAVNVIVKPVLALAMGPGPQMYIEVSELRTRVELRQFIILSDGGENVVKVKPYHFTGWDKYGPGQFDTDKFATYTKDDFWTDPSWECELEAIANGIFFGGWPVTTHKGVNGTRLTWGCIFLCDQASVTIPAGGDEVRDVVPYYYKRTCPKFPLINPPADYVSPCDQKLCPCGKS